MALLWCVKSARFRFNFPFNWYWNLNKRFFYQAYQSLPSCEHLWNNDETNLSKEKIEFFISHVFDNTHKKLISETNVIWIFEKKSMYTKI